MMVRAMMGMPMISQCYPVVLLRIAMSSANQNEATPEKSTKHIAN